MFPLMCSPNVYEPIPSRWDGRLHLNLGGWASLDMVSIKPKWLMVTC